MNRDQFAALLNGREYRNEITRAEEARANALGLIVIYGASDDLTEFAGVLSDERGACNGAEFYIGADGKLHPTWAEFVESDDCTDEDKARAWFRREDQGAVKVEALWCAEDGYSWTFKTEAPHSTFEIVEDGEPYCRGIVIALDDLVKP